MLKSTGDDFEILLDFSESGDVLFNLGKDGVSFDKLTEGLLVAVEVASFIESDLELGAIAVLTVVEKSELTSLHVSEGEVLIGEAHTVGTVVVFGETASGDGGTGETGVERGAGVAEAFLGSFAESLEVVSGIGCAVLVELEDEVTDDLLTVGDGEENSGVSGVGVVVDGSNEATSGSLDELFGVHFIFMLFIIKLITNRSQINYSPALMFFFLLFLKPR